ncbi:dihydrolipoamide acetyltransferase family protein [Mucilaginibacter glaciei]|uniref:Dihydrolipoamide acetyltransferase component of pyruvate dehydrogenase complex n=1 Tax=Mucilaginibacter glaciei TaxID=2772109 RepID=A0A926S0U0_9SPHI|nr:dihydrolipoamide acetyltransferase family protein [Mucilaginibacter glaciei]MBD1392082.1 2-oxo acid dehydrogenase subunit E2 [Mucilaginibacter glaciei]
MAKYQLLLPKMGESVAEATVIKWNKNPGDYIEADEAVMEIATDKVDSEVPSPVAGKLIEQLFQENDVVQVGSVIAIIEVDGPDQSETAPASAAAPKAVTAETETEDKPESVVPQSTPEPVTQPERETKTETEIPGISQLQDIQPEQSASSGQKFENRFYSPLVKNIAVQEGIGNDELDTIPGTGAEARLTKDDLLAYIQKRGSRVAAPQSVAPETQSAPQPEVLKYATPIAVPQPQAQKPQTPSPQPQPAATPPPALAAKPVTSVSGGDEIIEMDRMRKLIAEHMIMSKHTSPHVTSFVEADVTNLVQWRDKVKSAFEKREGEKITFTPIFIEAVVRAIKDLPMINVQVNGTQIIKKKDINISMATALPSGNLIVPVIKKADQLSLIGITKAVNDLANRARNGKLAPDDVKDGTFTITNVGSFGNVMGTPIINQPQVAILAVGAIKKKPAVVETPQGDAIAIRHMMFLSLSYDHRVVDGALGGMFVKKVADYLENWDINRNI